MPNKRVFSIYLSECLGTALLLAAGLSVVILLNGEGSPFRAWIPSGAARRALTGFLFGSTGCLITLSPIGKISGAHINPIVSIAFYLKRKISGTHALGFVISQMTGALLIIMIFFFAVTGGSDALRLYDPFSLRVYGLGRSSAFRRQYKSGPKFWSRPDQRDLDKLLAVLGGTGYRRGDRHRVV